MAGERGLYRAYARHRDRPRQWRVSGGYTPRTPATGEQTREWRVSGGYTVRTPATGELLGGWRVSGGYTPRTPATRLNDPGT